MIFLQRGETVDPDSPKLLFIGQNQGQIVAAKTLAYRIFDPSGAQVFPVSGKQDVDLDLDAVATDPNNRQGGGVYAARWTVPTGSAAPTGIYQIEWTYELTTPVSSTFTSIATEPSPKGIIRKPFEVLDSTFAIPGPFYVSVSDTREEIGCTPQDVSDRRLLKLIGLASLLVERATGRFFEPRFAFLRYDGNSSRKLLIGPPIIGVSSVGIDTQPTQAGDLVVELDLLRIYNRHLSQGMLDRDDRNNPKIEFVHSDDLYGVRFVPFRGISLRSLAFPIGVQNVHVRGCYGYTDPDGSPWGDTPRPLARAVQLIVARELPKIGDTDAREDAQWRWRVTSDKARDISVDMIDPYRYGCWFGDPAIDSLLASYVRPPMFGAA